MKNKKKKKNKNVFRHLTGVLLKNYGIFFNSEDLEEEVVL